jgi:hypothetical protein
MREDYNPCDPREGCLGFYTRSNGIILSVWKITGYMYNLCVHNRYIIGVYDNVYNYANPELALEWMAKWDGTEVHEPEGWFRHPATGRRRPDGDKEKEYINP